MSKHTLPAIAIAILGGAAVAQGALSAPCFVTTLGNNLGLTDDSVAVGLPLGFTCVAPGGSTVTTISVSSNGFVWLGNNANPGCCDGDPTKLGVQGPRIAPFWVDLNPGAGGAVWFNALPASGTTSARAEITWDQVPEFQLPGSVVSPMTFQLQLFPDGSFVVYYDPSVGSANRSALVGVSQGINGSFNFVDISASIGSPIDTGTDPTVFETFFGPIDLASNVLTFVRNAQGGYQFTSKPGCTFAGVTSFGAGCPQSATYYELFPAGFSLDLSLQGIEFTPRPGGGYTTASTNGFFTGQTNLIPFADDEVRGPFNLTFPFAYPGGTTTAIDISSNGFIWMQPTPLSVPLDPRCCEGVVAEFLNDRASLCVLWQNLLPNLASAGDGVFFDVVGNEAHITWRGVPDFSGLLNTAQITLRANGSYRLAWGIVGNGIAATIVGFSEGGGVGDPGPVDLSALNFAIGTGGLPLTLNQSPGARPILGIPFVVSIGNIASGSALGFLALGAAPLSQPVDLSPLGSSDCRLFVPLSTVRVVPLTGNPTPFSLALPANPTLIGVTFAAQAATLSPGANPLGILTSNALELRVGL